MFLLARSTIAEILNFAVPLLDENVHHHLLFLQVVRIVWFKNSNNFCDFHADGWEGDVIPNGLTDLVEVWVKTESGRSIPRVVMHSEHVGQNGCILGRNHDQLGSVGADRWRNSCHWRRRGHWSRCGSKTAAQAATAAAVFALKILLSKRNSYN